MNIVQIQNRVQELPNTPQTMQYLQAAMNGQIATVPPYVAAAELKRRETEGMMDQLAKGAAQGPQPTVKDQLAQKAGIMALQGQQQPPPRPQIPQPEPAQPQGQAEGGIDNLPVNDEMFGMAGGGIVGYNGQGGSYVTPYDRMNQENRKREAARDGKPLDETAAKDRAFFARLLEALKSGNEDVGRAIADVATLPVRGLAGAYDTAVVRPMRAAGINAAYLSPKLTPEGADVSSMTPFADVKQERGAQSAEPQQQEKTYTRGSPEQAQQIRDAAASGAFGRVAERKPTGEQRAPRADTERPAAGPAAPQQAKTAEGILAALENDPAFARLMQGVNAPNPYTGKDETPEAYLKRRNEAILGQIPGGKMPWETSEARLKDIEARRAKEDADYKAKTTGEGRRLDNLVTFLSNVGPGSFGMGGAQGVRAVQKLERDQQQEALKRQEMRDQQAQKMAEIRTLNDQAVFAYATGNFDKFESLQKEIQKLKLEFDKDQATLARGAAAARADAAKADQESRDKAADRASQERRTRMMMESRAGTGGDKQMLSELKALQTSLKDQLKGEFNRARREQISAELAQVNAAIAKMAGLDTMGGAPGAGSPGGTMSGWGKAQVVK